MMLELITRILGKAEDPQGQTLVEYALIIALVATAIVASLTALRIGIGNVFMDMVAQF
jgi:Flp pilus assembly pilin Flp